MQVAIVAVNHWQHGGEQRSEIWHGAATRNAYDGDFEIDLPRNIITLLQEAEADKAIRLRVIVE